MTAQQGASPDPRFARARGFCRWVATKDTSAPYAFMSGMNDMNFRLKVIVVFILLVLVLTPPSVYGGLPELEPPFPEWFATTADAVNAGCERIRFKSPDSESLMLAGWHQQEAIIVIYDPTPNGHFRKAHEFRITSWYGEATVSHADWLKRGTDFILVKFEGNTGTGTLQKILGVFGWNGKQLVPVLLETVSYYECSSPNHCAEIDNDFNISHEKTGKPVFTANYKLWVRKKGADADTVWTDRLQWDDKLFAFRFLSGNSSKPKSMAGKIVRQAIQKAREGFLESRPIGEPITIDLDYLEKIGIMEILDPQ